MKLLDDGQVSDRFICRTHGEFLCYHFACNAWVCPEHAVCGTWVGDEVRR